MIIKIETATGRHTKRTTEFCEQIAHGELLPVDAHPTKKQAAGKTVDASRVRTVLVPMLRRRNRDVSKKARNEIRATVLEAWAAWRDAWSLPDTETVKVSFPDEVDDAWHEGRHYYIFTGSCSRSRVVRF